MRWSSPTCPGRSTAFWLTSEGVKQEMSNARFGTVEEIAHTALFLASPESGFITGITRLMAAR